MKNEAKKIRVLRVLLSITETSAPYNQFSLTLASRQDITICTYFRTKINISKKIILFQGNNTLSGFFRVLKTAINARAYDVIHAHTPHVGFLFILASLFISPKLLSSTVYTVHSYYSNYKFRNRLMLVWVFLFFRRIICCSHASYASFPKFYKKIAGARLSIIQNGVDITRVDSVIEGGVRPSTDEFTLVVVGRLIQLKNLPVLLKAFANSNSTKARLLLIGEGPMLNGLQAYSEQLGIDSQVVFKGLIPREKVYQQLVQADLLVSTSTIEGLPIAVLEAMACRCPVIISDIPPHREICSGVNFIPLVPIDDVDGFAREIARFRNMEEGERRINGEKCRELVENRFSLQDMLSKYNNLYQEVACCQKNTLL